jgi:excisionase family DNA binding protein
MTVAEREKLLYTIREVEDVLGLSRAAIYNLINAGELRRVKVGKAARIPRASLVAYVDRLEAECADAR